MIMNSEENAQNHQAHLDERLGENLRKIRESTKLSQLDFFNKYLSGTERGVKLKTDQSKINRMSMLESGKKRPSYEALLVYSDVSGISIDQMLRSAIVQVNNHTAAPRTLADMYQLLLDFGKFTPFHSQKTEVNEDGSLTVSLYMKIAASDLSKTLDENRYPQFITDEIWTEPNPKDYENAMRKIILLVFINQLRHAKKINKLIKDNPEIPAPMDYIKMFLKEHMQEAKNYSTSGMRLRDSATSYQLVEQILSILSHYNSANAFNKSKPDEYDDDPEADEISILKQLNELITNSSSDEMPS